MTDEELQKAAAVALSAAAVKARVGNDFLNFIVTYLNIPRFYIWKQGSKCLRKRIVIVIPVVIVITIVTILGNSQIGSIIFPL